MTKRHATDKSMETMPVQRRHSVETSRNYKNNRFLARKTSISVLIFNAVALPLLLMGCLNSWPGISVDFSGLGDTKISRKLRSVWMNGDISISNSITSLIYEDQPLEVPITAKRLTEIGMECDLEEKNTCRYDRSLTYTAHGLPEANKRYTNNQLRLEITATINAASIDVATKQTRTPE